jgi:hypothetical protein
MQHRPAQSTPAPSGQQCPVTASMYPLQHPPLTSTTPSSHDGAAGAAASSGTSHPSPPHCLLHSHLRLTELHIQWLEGQSLSPKQSHVGASVQGVDCAGFRVTLRAPDWRHTVSGRLSLDPLRAAAPVLWHVTARVWRPGPPSQGRTGVASGTQDVHGPTVHDARVPGQGKRLQGRVVLKPLGACEWF